MNRHQIHAKKNGGACFPVCGGFPAVFEQDAFGLRSSAFNGSDVFVRDVTVSHLGSAFDVSKNNRSVGSPQRVLSFICAGGSRPHFD
jgi:hypothetical protein